MAFLTNTSAESAPLPAKSEPSTLGQIYRVFGVLAILGAIVAVVFGILNGRFEEAIIAGLGCVVTAVLFFGFAEFFNQIARIAAATEETTRILRQRPPV
jgi:hypothetical protein